ncbi:DUF4470 and zf-MYND domain-containing protein [Phanerochaete sordida]|uniref:DUF4470 and zf-MYND domain-containing protein n=1 Tax=Phanerochaete sordida TaxID=48140 RepID=A0A9P3L7I2_9APHY|nr:DUF4470 and zf-MYND domain-containing protein [Phanerochaete sordida]
MAKTLVWPAYRAFCPLGNTSPISLLGHMPPEQDASILLLGCGDPRNVLFTLQAHGANQPSASRKLDFTYCNVDPAILARAIVLFTLIAEGEHVARPSLVWSAFYHVFLDEASTNALLEHCEKLLELSADLDTWNTCHYAHFLEIGSSFTLSQLRRQWSLYVQTRSQPPVYKTFIKEEIISYIQKVYNDGSTLGGASVARSAGPAWQQAVDMGGASSRAFWRSGTTFTSQRDIESATEVNPMFMFSHGLDGFVLYEGTSALASFHMAPMVAAAGSKEKVNLEKAVEFARLQFRAWCETFSACIRDSSRKITIRFVLADPLGFCQALTIAGRGGDPSKYPRVTPWRASLLQLDGKGYTSCTAPLYFDTIDTSNLSDHLGLLNFVLAAKPLLKPTPSSVLYTETLLPNGDDPFVSCLESLRGDMTSMSILLDITPVPYLAGFNTQSSTHELMRTYLQQEVAQAHERLVWKMPSQLTLGTCHPLSADPDELAGLLFEVYKRMFAHESIGEIPEAEWRAWLDRIHFTRRSFANLLCCIAHHVRADWTLAVKRLGELLRADPSPLRDMRNYQDLLMHLHLLGLHSSGEFQSGSLQSNPSMGLLRDWSTAPPVVCIAFLVPRMKLKFVEANREPINIYFAIELANATGTHRFSSFDTAFGSLLVAGTGEHAHGIIEEDPNYIPGSASVVVSACVPAWLLADDLDTTTIRLVIVDTIARQMWHPALGKHLVVHEVPLHPASGVHILRERPTIYGDAPAAIPCLPPPKLPTEPATITLSISDAKVQKMTRRADVTEPEAKAALAIKSTSVTVKQASGCELLLSIGLLSREKLGFPFGIDAAQAKLRVARQSSYIEVVVSPSLFGGRNAPVRFPMVMHGKTPVPWAMHRVDLDCLPNFVPGSVPKADSNWINFHLSFSFSEREMTTSMDPMARIKDHIRQLILDFVVPTPEGVTPFVFAIHRGNVAQPDIVFFTTGVRFDLAAHTLVADSFVLCVESSNAHELLPFLGHIRHAYFLPVIDIELDAWKQLLPSLVERCRTWEHGFDCMYLASDADDCNTPALCNCGRGRVTPEFHQHAEWAPFIPHVTRVAISPLFAVPCREPVVTFLRQERDKALEAKRSRASATPTQSQADAQKETTRCLACNAELALEKRMVCSRCKVALYCDRDCQLEHWKVHKRICKDE